MKNETGNKLGSDFEEIIDQYSPQLRRYLLSRLGSESDAQDLFQEAYLRLIRVKQPELIRSPESYLFRIASNLAGEFLLKRTQNPASVLLEDISTVKQEAKENSFETNIQTRAEIAQLEKILEKLPTLYRAVLLMRKRDGYSHKEIAEKLNIAPSTVHTYLKRAVLQCRTQWTEQ